MNWLEEASARIQYLEGVVVTTLPDCLAWEVSQKIEFDSEEIAAYFGDMVRAQRNACQTLSKDVTDIKLSIESEQFTVLATELNENFMAVFIFQSQTPLGMARLSMKRLASVIIENLPTEEVAVRSHGERILEFVKRYAPDSHSVMMRISLQTKIPLQSLSAPEHLTEAEIEKLETAVKSVLGVTEIRI